MSDNKTISNSTSSMPNPEDTQYRMTPEGLEITVAQTDTSIKIPSDEQFRDSLSSIKPTNYKDYDRVYLVKDVLNNLTSILPNFFDRSFLQEKSIVGLGSDWNKLRPNTFQVFVSTNGTNAPTFSNKDSVSGLVFTFQLKTEEIYRTYQIALAISQDISIALRGTDNDLDGAKWNYLPSITDYDTFKDSVTDTLKDYYNKLVLASESYKPENLQPIIDKATNSVETTSSQAKEILDKAQTEFLDKATSSLDKLNAIQSSMDNLQQSITDYSNQKAQDINDAYDSQMKDLEATYVKDVQKYIQMVADSQSALKTLQDSLVSIEASLNNVDLTNYYTKKETTDLVASKLDKYITSAGVDTKISNITSGFYTQAQMDDKLEAIKEQLERGTIDTSNYYTKNEVVSLLNNKVEGATLNGEAVPIQSKKLVFNIPRPDLSNYVTSDKVTSMITSRLSGYSSSSDLTNKLDSALASYAKLTDLTGYAPKSSLLDYVKTSTFNSRLSDLATQNDLLSYPTKTEMNTTLEGYQKKGTTSDDTLKLWSGDEDAWSKVTTPDNKTEYTVLDSDGNIKNIYVGNISLYSQLIPKYTKLYETTNLWNSSTHNYTVAGTPNIGGESARLIYNNSRVNLDNLDKGLLIGINQHVLCSSSNYAFIELPEQFGGQTVSSDGKLNFTNEATQNDIQAFYLSKGQILFALAQNNHHGKLRISQFTAGDTRPTLVNLSENGSDVNARWSNTATATLSIDVTYESNFNLSCNMWIPAINPSSSSGNITAGEPYIQYVAAL